MKRIKIIDTRKMRGCLSKGFAQKGFIFAQNGQRAEMASKNGAFRLVEVEASTLGYLTFTFEMLGIPRPLN